MIEIVLEYILASGMAMARQSKKDLERHFVERAAELMGNTWNFGPNRECPDFIVMEGAQHFGLEVCKIFTGSQDEAGSAMKRKESDIQRDVNALRHEYEAITNTLLCVRFVGELCVENMATVVQDLVAKDLSTKAIGHKVIIDAGNGLRVHATRALRANWFSMNRRVGWVDRKPEERIAAAIEKKSKELPRYRESAGPDIRLLIVANRIYNSGKMILEEQATLNLRDFQIVYFFSYPESVTVFDCADNTA